MSDADPTRPPPRPDPLLRSIELSPIATVVTDPRQPDNPIVAVNAAFAKLTGYAAEEITGRNCRFLAGPRTEPAAQETLRRAVREGRPTLTELWNYRKDGSCFRNAVMIAPILGEDGTTAFFLGSQMELEAGQTMNGVRVARAQTLVSTLTPRQRQVLDGMIGGYRNKQIAGFLGIDEKTVKMHRAGLLAKLGAATSADAIRIGVESGIAVSDGD